MSGLNRIAKSTRSNQIDSANGPTISNTYVPGLGNFSVQDKKKLEKLKNDIRSLTNELQLSTNTAEYTIKKGRIDDLQKQIQTLVDQYRQSAEERIRHWKYIKFAMGKPEKEDILALKKLHSSVMNDPEILNMDDKYFMDRYVALPGVEDEVMQVINQYFDIIRALVLLYYEGPKDNEQLKMYYKYFIESEIFTTHNEAMKELRNQIQITYNRDMNIMDMADYIIKLYGEESFSGLMESMNKVPEANTIFYPGSGTGADNYTVTNTSQTVGGPSLSNTKSNPKGLNSLLAQVPSQAQGNQTTK